MSFGTVAIIGLGLQGGSIGLAVQEFLPEARTTGYDFNPATRARAAELGLVHSVCETAEEAVGSANLVIFCVPPGAMGESATQVRDAIPADALVSDVGSCKQSIAAALREALPDHTVIPAHPVAGTENSGPDAGFAHLFRNRWCILTPAVQTDLVKLSQLVTFWEALGANVEIMDARHHDLVLAVTSHLPHLIAYTIVGTASDLEDVTQSEVIKYSAGGFRDFTRIASSDPVMWRDICLANREALSAALDRYTEDLARLAALVRSGDGQALEQVFQHAKQARDRFVAMLEP